MSQGFIRSSVAMAIRAIYLLLAVTAALQFFIFSLSENYLALNTGKDTFYSSLPIIPAFAALFILAFFDFLYCIFSPRIRQQRLIGSSAILLCFAATFYFKDELLLLGDRLFFSLNKEHFAVGISDGVTPTPSFLFQRSSYNFYKIFVYSGSFQLSDGRVAQPTLEAVFGSSVAGWVGCDIVANRLSGSFYVLNVYC
jgi:hypothetical protein